MTGTLKHPMFFTNAEIEKILREECERRGWSIPDKERPEMKHGNDGDFVPVGAWPITFRVQIEVVPVSPRAK